MLAKQPITSSPRLFSGNKLLQKLFEMQLQGVQGSINVIIDSPSGYAFSCREEISAGSSLIVTNNPFSECIEDLCDKDTKYGTTQASSSASVNGTGCYVIGAAAVTGFTTKTKSTWC